MVTLREEENPDYEIAGKMGCSKTAAHTIHSSFNKMKVGISTRIEQNSQEKQPVEMIKLSVSRFPKGSCKTVQANLLPKGCEVTQLTMNDFSIPFYENETVVMNCKSIYLYSFK